MLSLAEITGLPVQQTVTVNSITEYSTYCTSIVARDEAGQISHVRNLDFGATEMMSKLVYMQVLVKDGQVMGEAPSIAGYMGTYTGQRPGIFSFSYNVRETVVNPSSEMIYENLEKTLDPEFQQIWIMLQDLLLKKEVTFDSAVETIMNTNVTSPGYIIVGGVHGNEGVVVSRNSIGTNHTHWLSDDEWYVAQTNRDIWTDFKDHRYNTTVKNMDKLG